MLSKWYVFLLLPLCLCARPGYFPPWGKDAALLAPPEQTPHTNSSLAVICAEKIILFHQNVLSPVDGPRSHFRPSSSNYMLQAMQKHGFFLGYVMGCDRLLRENKDPWCYQTMEEGGQLFKYNPVP